MASRRGPRSPVVRAAATGAGNVLAALWALVTSPLRFVRWLADWLRWWGASRRRRVALVGLLAVVVLSAMLTRSARLDLRYDEARADRAETAETFYIPPPMALRALSLGHEAFLGDLLFIKTRLYFMSHLFGDRIFDWLDTYVGTIIALDPDNEKVYEWAAQAAKYGQLITNEALEQSNSYSRMGIERFPDNWRFYFDIGFNYFIEWRTTGEEERERMRRKALTWFSIASALPGSELDPNFVAELYLQDNDVEMALFHAYLRYWEASDREKEALRARITRYESEAVAAQLEDIEARWRSEFPYVPFGLFQQLGPEHAIEVPRSWSAVGGQLAEMAEGS